MPFAHPARIRVAQDVGPEPHATKQSFRDDTDVNKIMSKFQRTGILSHVNKYSGMYGEIPALDFQEAQNLIIRARQMFADLPSAIRSRFKDPGEFLEFVQDPKNQPQLEELGLAAPAPSGPPGGEALEGGSGGTT